MHAAAWHHVLFRHDRSVQLSCSVKFAHKMCTSISMSTCTLLYTFLADIPLISQFREHIIMLTQLSTLNIHTGLGKVTL